MNNFLFNLYFKDPLKIKNIIVRKITQKDGQMYSLT